MEILSALGVNSTIWLQFACFIIAYLALSQLVFKPYLAAFEKRAERTTGSEEQAEKLLQETQTLQHQYETRAREINQTYKNVFDQTRTEATREQERILTEARSQAHHLLEQNRKQIQAEITASQDELTRQAPSVGLAIASKLVGKELAQ